MSQPNLALWRLHAQRMIASKFTEPVQAVEWLGAVQAQDYAGSKWGLGLRTTGALDRDVERAFADGQILRTHLLRPTWHFVAASDIRWMLELTAPRVHAANRPLYQRVGLDDETTRRSNKAIAEALRGGQWLTRNELRDVLNRAGVATEGQMRVAYLMMQAELDGVVCSGPRRGNQFTYALLEERAPLARSLSRQDALAELAQRYFTSRGPASVADFAKWSGLTLRDARAGIEAVAPKLGHDTFGAQTYWFDSAPPADEPSPVAHLLSIYDEYISGYKDRTAMVQPDHARALVSMGNALTTIILVDGHVVGTWKRTVRGKGVDIEPSFFRPLTEAEARLVGDSARQYGEYLELPVTLSPTDDS